MGSGGTAPSQTEPEATRVDNPTLALRCVALQGEASLHVCTYACVNASVCRWESLFELPDGAVGAEEVRVYMCVCMH